MSKKGALNLGISTIVVLVIAMVLIAGFVSFIRTFLDTGEESLMGAFDVADFGKQPTAQDPVVLARGSISLGQRESDTVRVPIGYYNADSETYRNVKVRETVTCNSGVEFKITAIDFEQVTPGEAVGFETILNHFNTENSKPGNYICRITIEDGEKNSLASMQQTIKVEG